MERRLLLEAAVAVVAVRVALTLLPFRTTHRLAERWTRREVGGERAASAGGRGADGASPERIMWAVGAAARRVPRASCLTQALAASLLLARWGHATVLRLGVARGADGRLRAHAWLEGDGRVYGRAPSTEKFVALPAIDLGRPR